MNSELFAANRGDYFTFKNFLIPLALSALLVAMSFFNFLLFHTLAEGFAIVVGVLMCVVIWHTRYFAQHSFLMFIANGFFWVAALDLFHTLSYKGMGVFQADANMPTQLWVATRFFEALILLYAPNYLKTESSSRVRTFVTFGGVAILILGLIFVGWFPDAYIEGEGLTTFKIACEYLIIGLLIAALIHLRQHRHEFDDQLYLVINVAIAFTIVSEFAFTFYVSVYGLSNMVGHIFKFLAFYLIFDAIVRRTLQGPMTALQQANKTIENQNERFQLVLRGTGLGVWDWNPQSGAVVFDERWCQMLGYELDEIEPNVESWSSRVHPDDIESCFKDIQAHVNGETEHYDNIHRMQHRNGRWIYIHDRGQVFSRDSEGKAIRFTGIHEDVTQRIENEQKRNDLYGMVAHELRTPVSAISMMTEDPDFSDFGKFSKDIHRAARDLMFTLDDMRLLINPDLKRPVRIEQFNFEDVTTAVGYSVAGVVARSGFSFNSFNAVPETLINETMETDLYRLKVALTNLIKNACLHSEGSQVWIMSGVGKSSEGEDQIVWIVGDNGKGIPDETLKGLFNPFSRGDTKAEGTGMGLHIARSWIREIGGDLSYERRSTGSEFKLSIPLITARARTIVNYKHEFDESAVRRLKILVVEDDSVLRTVTVKLLEKLGAIVESAENGRIGLTKLDESYDLVLTDYFMPEMTGVDLIKRARSEGVRTPIVGVTAATIGEEQATMQAAGADLVLQKPLNRTSVTKTVNKLIKMGRLKTKKGSPID